MGFALAYTAFLALVSLVPGWLVASFLVRRGFPRTLASLALGAAAFASVMGLLDFVLKSTGYRTDFFLLVIVTGPAGAFLMGGFGSLLFTWFGPLRPSAGSGYGFLVRLRTLIFVAVALACLCAYAWKRGSLQREERLKREHCIEGAWDKAICGPKP